MSDKLRNLFTDIATHSEQQVVRLSPSALSYRHRQPVNHRKQQVHFICFKRKPFFAIIYIELLSCIVVFLSSKELINKRLIIIRRIKRPKLNNKTRLVVLYITCVYVISLIGCQLSWITTFSHHFKCKLVQEGFSMYIQEDSRLKSELKALGWVFVGWLWQTCRLAPNT